MAFVLHDRVKETSVSTGTGAFQLRGAPDSSWETFIGAIGDGNTTYYCIADAYNYEVGVGTIANATPYPTLTRTTVVYSSNSNSEVNWGSGSKDVFCCVPSNKLVYKDADGNFINLPSASATLSGVVELATQAEAWAGTSSTLAIPASLLNDRICFLAHKNGTNQSIATANPTLLTFGTAAINNGSQFNTTSYQFEPSAAGYYRLTLTIGISAGIDDGDQISAMIYKNGAVVRQRTIYAGGSPVSVDVSTIEEANGTTDVFAAFVDSNDPAYTVDGTASRTTFCGERL